uniref:Uncharacterized protein n=1 Tax=Strigamia maritima TaxID=126957 RepID=T1J200_STRMM
MQDSNDDETRHFFLVSVESVSGEDVRASSANVHFAILNKVSFYLVGALVLCCSPSHYL